MLAPWSAMSRSGRALVGAAGATFLIVAASPAAQAATSSTTVTPAGDSFTASLASGTTADFTLGQYVVSCSVSSSTGSVPTSNTNASGAVSTSVSPATFTNCTTNTALFSASVTSNSTNGSWSIGLQNDPAGSTATLTVPKGGVVVKTSGFVSCTIVVGPNGAAGLAGTWTNGSPSQLGFTDTAVPVSVTGFFCPTDITTATFTANYNVTDTTDATQNISVTA